VTNCVLFRVILKDCFPCSLKFELETLQLLKHTFEHGGISCTLEILNNSLSWMGQNPF
jgi:hypothetical protein